MGEFGFICYVGVLFEMGVLGFRFVFGGRIMETLGVFIGFMNDYLGWKGFR